MGVQTVRETRDPEYTVSSHINTQFRIACIPPFGPKVIYKSVVTQCEVCLGITLTHTFILIRLETLWAFMRKDTECSAGHLNKL